MTKTITVGLQKKIGQPNFGSVGASCTVEVRLDDEEALDADMIAARVKHAYDRCRHSIEEELDRHDQEGHAKITASTVHRSSQ